MVAWSYHREFRTSVIQSPVTGWQDNQPPSGSLEKRFTEDPEQSDIPLSEDDMDIAIGASGTTSTTSAAPTEQDRTPVVQDTPPTVEQDSETVTPLPECTMTRHYPSRVRKPPERYSTLMYGSLFGGRGMQ